VKWQQINTNQQKQKLYYWNDIDTGTKNIESAEYNIGKKYIYENSNRFILSDFSKNQIQFTPVEKTYIEGFKLFSSERKKESGETIYKITKNNTERVIEQRRYEVNIDGIYYYGMNQDVLKKEVESHLYKNYNVEYYNNIIEVSNILEVPNEHGYIGLTPHNDTYLNDNDEIQIADNNAIYDDADEKYEFYCSYNNKVYNINFGVVTIPKKHKVIEYNDNYLILYDIYSSLMFNMNARLSNEIFGNIKKITFSNKLESSHNQTILMSVKYNIENNKDETKYGKCILRFQ
jgi:hypothetical protein